MKYKSYKGNMKKRITRFLSLPGRFHGNWLTLSVASVNTHVYIALWWCFWSSMVLNVLTINKNLFNSLCIISQGSVLIWDSIRGSRRVIFTKQRSPTNILLPIFHELVLLHSNIYKCQLNHKLKHRIYYLQMVKETILTKASTNILNFRGFRWSFEALQLNFSNSDHLQHRREKLSRSIYHSVENFKFQVIV